MGEIFTYTRSGAHTDECQRYASTQIPSSAWRRSRSIQTRIEDGKINLKNFDRPIVSRKLLGIDGEPIDFEWIISQDLHHLEILQKIQNDLQDHNIDPEDSEDRIIFKSMFSDIDWTM